MIPLLAILSILTGLLFIYEGVALLSPLPTISRLVQGWRDSGASTAVEMLSLALLGTATAFFIWLRSHLTKDRRSNL